MFDLAILQNDKIYKLNFILTFKCLGLLTLTDLSEKTKQHMNHFFKKNLLKYLYEKVIESRLQSTSQKRLVRVIKKKDGKNGLLKSCTHSHTARSLKSMYGLNCS